MSEKRVPKTFAIAVGAALASSLAAIPAANADENPFGLTKLSGDYLAACKEKEGKCGEGKCGEGKCGGDK